MIRLPNVLSGFRILAAPILLMLAWHGETELFLVLFALGLLSDVLDGRLARSLGCESEFGAKLDQWGDFALWGVLPLAAWWLWPGIVAREAGFVALALVCMLLPTMIGYAKYRAVPGYHTWSVKIGSALMAIGAVLLLIFDLAWPFRVAASFQLVCALDEVGITLLLSECRHDVPSVFHAVQLRRDGVTG